MQQDIWVHYQNLYPGQVQVVGVDLWDGSAAQMQSFKSQTGATYPLLLCGTLCPGGNVSSLYGTYDNYIVLNKQGIVRYHAADLWPHGNRYHLNEIRSCVDSLVMSTAGVGDDPGPRGHALAARPNPFRAVTEIELLNSGPARDAQVAVHDAAGRRVALLWDDVAPPGQLRVTWEGRDDRGVPVPPGLYLVRAEVGTTRLTRRIVRLR